MKIRSLGVKGFPTVNATTNPNPPVIEVSTNPTKTESVTFKSTLFLPNGILQISQCGRFPDSSMLSFQMNCDYEIINFNLYSISRLKQPSNTAW